MNLFPARIPGVSAKVYTRLRVSIGAELPRTIERKQKKRPDFLYNGKENSAHLSTERPGPTPSSGLVLDKR